MYNPAALRSRSPSLPSWYHRILEYPDNTVTPGDFDEDISEIGSESDFEGSDDRSHDGSEYDYYYDLKEQREERKEHLQEMIREGRPTQKEEDGQWELEFERDVKKVLDEVRQRPERGERLNLRNRHFTLGSVDQFQHAYLGNTPQSMSKYVTFYDYREILYHGAPDSWRPPPGQEPGVEGHVYMYEDTVSYFRGPVPPERTGLEKFTCEDGQHKLTFQFLDNSHLIMEMPRELVYAEYPRKMPPDAPETFVFYGIEDDAMGRRGQ